MDFHKTLKEIGEEGYVESIIESVCYVDGLPGAKINEIVLMEEGQMGLVQSLNGDFAEVVILSGQPARHKLRVTRTNSELTLPVSQDFLGRVIDPLGNPLDGKDTVISKTQYRLDSKAPELGTRSRVNKALETGVTAVDMQVPIGKGQRQLLLGDQKTGKTSFALQAIANQVRHGAVAIYASIGKKRSDLQFVEKTLTDMEVISRTVIVSTSASDSSPLVYLTPFAALALAEYFRDQGWDVLVVLDDLTTHAKFYRENSLLSKRTPGRQSYPGDIFHLHARLMERAGNFHMSNGNDVAITLLPVAETVEGDLAGYIQTNLMAMTDGHLFFDISELKKGRHPAINFNLSVSRVGNQTKTPLERELSDLITEKLTTYKKAEEVSRFGVELTVQTLRALNSGEKLIALFDQDNEIVISKDLQLIFLALLLSGYWDQKTLKQVRVEKFRLLGDHFQGKFGNLPNVVKTSKSVQELVSHVVTFFKGVKNV